MDKELREKWGEGEVYGEDISWKEREDGNKDGRVEEGDRGWGGEGSAGSAGRVVRWRLYSFH